MLFQSLAVASPAATRRTGQRVLIVDGSEDNREVLRTVLERRGIEIFEASEASRGAELARDFRPEVIILDDEAADAAAMSDFRNGESENSRLVVLGKARHDGATLPKDRIIPKPYHFAPLIRKIEQLLTSSTDS